MKNVFEAITQFGHDEDFVPRVTDDFLPTAAPAGSPEKIEALARRVQAGVPLWHPEDRCDYSGLTGVSARASSSLGKSTAFQIKRHVGVISDVTFFC